MKKINKNKNGLYVIIIIILSILLICLLYLIYINNKKYENKMEKLQSLLPYAYNSIVQGDNVNFDIDDMELIVYDDGTYAKEYEIDLASRYGDDRDEHILKVTEGKSYEDGPYLNLYLDNTFIDKLVFNECYKCNLSKKDYNDSINELKKEYKKNHIIIDHPFVDTNVSFYIIRNEGFAILSDYNDNETFKDNDNDTFIDGFTKERLTFYDKNGRVGDDYIVGDYGPLSYANISNLVFNGKTFKYWELDCDKKQGVLKSLTFKNGKIIERETKRDNKIYSNAIEESNIYSSYDVCKS